MQISMKVSCKLTLWMGKHSQSFQNSKFVMFLQYISKKKLEMKLIFCLHRNIKVSYKLISTRWASKFPTRWYYLGMIKHSQSAQGNKFVISLQYLKKEVSDRVHFLHADKHQGFYKVALLFLVKVARHVQGIQNRKLVIFLQYLKKKILMKFVFCIQVKWKFPASWY